MKNVHTALVFQDTDAEALQEKINDALWQYKDCSPFVVAQMSQTATVLDGQVVVTCILILDKRTEAEQ